MHTTHTYISGTHTFLIHSTCWIQFYFPVRDLVIKKYIFFEETITVIDGGAWEAQRMFSSITQRPFALPLRNLAEVSK